MLTTTQVLMLCFKLYNSRDASVHNTAGVAIRQVVSAMFERLNILMKEEEEEEDEDVGKGGQGSRSETHKQLPTQARDAYLLFQVRTKLPLSPKFVFILTPILIGWRSHDACPTCYI